MECLHSTIFFEERGRPRGSRKKNELDRRLKRKCPVDEMEDESLARWLAGWLKASFLPFLLFDSSTSLFPILSTSTSQSLSSVASQSTKAWSFQRTQRTLICVEVD